MVSNRLQKILLSCVGGTAVFLSLMTLFFDVAPTLSREAPTASISSQPGSILTATLEPAAYLPLIMNPLPVITGCVPIPNPEIPPSDIDNEADILSGINQQRTANSFAPLAQVSELTQSARRHSLDMATQSFTDHTGSDGMKPGDRMTDACYEWRAYGEIIGWGFGGSAARMIEWWMNSPPHKATILSGNFEDFGAGYIRDENSDWGHYWTVNFGWRDTQQTSKLVEQYVCEYTVTSDLGGMSALFLSAKPCIEFD